MLRKVAAVLGIAFVLFFVITQPAMASEAVRDILGWLEDGAEAAITFTQNIFS